MGTSCFPHFTHSPFSNSSSSLCSSQFTPLLSCSRNAQRCKKKRPVLLCMQSENQKEGDLCRRRTILFVGFSVLPLLNLRAKAFEEWPVGKSFLLILQSLFNDSMSLCYELKIIIWFFVALSQNVFFS